MKFGAIYGKGRGIQGQTYGIVTKNLQPNYFEGETGITYKSAGFRSVSKEQISKNIQELYDYANKRPNKSFLIIYKNDTYQNGNPKRSLNGYTGEEILDMFFDNKEVPENIVFHESFKPLIQQKINMKNQKNIKEEYTFFFSLHSVFSNFHPAKFEYKGITFISVEQFMMFSKAKLFKDEYNAKKIMDFNNSFLAQKLINNELTHKDIVNDKNQAKVWNEMMKKIKACGRNVKNYKEEIWDSKRFNIVSVAAREKFNQNIDMKKELLNTKNSILVETALNDKIWGIGLSASDPRAKDPSQWQGLNLLGKILTNLKYNYALELKNKPKNKNKL